MPQKQAKNIDVEINDVQTKIENQEDKEEILKNILILIS